MTQSIPTASADPIADSTPIPRRRRWLRFLLITGAVMFTMLALLPTVITYAGGTSQVRSNLARALGTEVELESVSIGWFSGLTVEGLEIRNPKGFPDEPAVKLASLTGDISLLQLLRGHVDLQGKVAGLELHLVQKEDGSINLEQLGDARPPVDAGPPTKVPGTGPDDGELSGLLDRLRLDLVLENATVLVEHETLGTIERIHDLSVTVKKPFGATDIVLDLGAKLGSDAAPGKIELAVDADAAMQRPANIRFACEAIDLARYRPMLVARMPDRIEEFSGMVEGEIHAKVDPKAEVLLDGELRVVEPRLSGDLFAGMTIHAPMWTIRPGIVANLANDPPDIDTGSLSVDLGFATLTGVAAERTTELCGGAGFGADFGLDLAKLTSFGGAIPADLRAENVKLDGTIALRAEGGEIPMDLEGLLAAVGLDAKFEAGQLEVRDRLLEDLVTDISIRDGALAIQTRDGAKVDGGSLSLGVHSNLAALTTEPMSIAIRVGNANVGGSAVEGLRFVVPLLAGIAPDAASVDFQSSASLTLDLSGPVMPAADEDTFAWLEKWSGSGDLGLANGSFTPAPAISGLLEFAGQRQVLEYDAFSTVFGLDAGSLTTDAMKFISGDRELGLKGKTTIRGVIDYSLDVASFLRGHKDGEKVLEAIGTDALDAGLTGTLTDPRLNLPNVQGLLKKAAGNAAQDLLQKQLDKLGGKAPKELKNALDGLGGLFGSKKKPKKDGNDD